MKAFQFKQRAVSATVSSLFAATGAVALMAAPAFGQQAAAPAATATAAAQPDSLGLERIVVTATSGNQSKLKSSISVTTVDDDLVKAMNPQTQSEVLRLIPGVIDNGGNGPGGNANITVRGLPITTGGSPFVQIQEDGLPTVLFGDMNFGNNDYWIRFDRSNTIEAVRGGSASTAASGAPGAVINYITDDGDVPGGQIGIEEGIGYNSNKAYFAVGGPVASGLRYHAEGYVTEGTGVRNQGFNAQQGYQIKANATKELGKLGWLRFNLKLLDDAEPLYTSYPALVAAGANSFSGISAFPGFDARTGSTVGVYNQTIDVMDNTSGQLGQKKSDGLHPVANAYGMQLHLTPGNGYTIDDKFRYTQMSGSFSTNFMSLTPTASVIGSTVNGRTVGKITNAVTGQAFTDTYLNSGVQIYTHMGDMGSLANDLGLNKTLDFGGSKLHVAGGLFYMDQHIAQDWHPNQHYESLVGHNPVPLNLYDTTGQLLTRNGVSGYNTAWGDGTNRSYDIQAADTAPYLNMNWETGPFQLDLGLRHDQLKTTGWAMQGSAATDHVVMMDGALVDTVTLDPNTYEALNYGASYNSYTVGGLYSLNNDTSVFARVSKGGRFNVDRNILSGYTNPDGSLNSSGQQLAVSMVQQQEIGIKRKGHVAGIGYSLNGTLFHNTYSSSNYDLTKGPAGTYYNSAYKATGLELEGAMHSGGFGLIGNMTYTQALITANAQGPTPQSEVSTGVGNQPANTPSLMFMLAPSYSIGNFTAGLMIQGRGRTNVNTAPEYWAPGFTLLHLNLSYEFAPGATVSLNVHNLTNKLFTSGLDQGNGILGQPQVNGQPVGTVGANNGRVTVLGLNYAF
ncbi:MAG: TonB-dependent receptor [Burkholderiales bacterium]|nr:TonB-dependent receptor [Burkholderiales bacterium]MDE1928017.1 TonB-dependent receptor [Burkholderiales bacterium]MDE2158886.1 TonB-dependent receptor [Burkholderiales bacterium]MDE2503137.1 TonB-dependent receptor [Burkholderiales bacterium]